MHFKIEGGEMYIYIYTKSAEWCYDDIYNYIYVCDEKSEDHKTLRRIFTPYLK